jgi:hypothetical protein
VPDAALAGDARRPIVAGAWAAGTAFTADFGSRAALSHQRPAQRPLMARIHRWCATPGTAITPRALSVDGFMAPLHVKLTTVGGLGANQALNGSRIVLLPGSTGTLAPLVGPGATVLVEEFAGSVTASGSVGLWAWNHANIGGAGGALTKGAVLGRPGTCILDPGAAGANVYALYTGNWYASDDDATWEFLLAVMTVDANALARAGIATGTVNASPPATGWWIERGYAGGAWQLVTSNGGSQSTVSLGVTPASGGYALLRLRKAGATVYGSVGGSAEVSLATNVMANAGVARSSGGHGPSRAAARAGGPL